MADDPYGGGEDDEHSDDSDQDQEDSLHGNRREQILQREFIPFVFFGHRQA